MVVDSLYVFKLLLLAYLKFLGFFCCLFFSFFFFSFRKNPLWPGFFYRRVWVYSCLGFLGCVGCQKPSTSVYVNPLAWRILDYKLRVRRLYLCGSLSLGFNFSLKIYCHLTEWICGAFLLPMHWDYRLMRISALFPVLSSIVPPWLSKAVITCSLACIEIKTHYYWTGYLARATRKSAGTLGIPAFRRLFNAGS